MSSITLSKAVRSNLLNLQSTADLLAKSQSRLASGLRVNSALDNPTNFFTAQNLTSRAGDLTQLMDAISTGIKTVQAADDGITAISKLVESAQATARQALQTAATIGGTTASVATSNTSSLTITSASSGGPAIVTGSAPLDYNATTASTGISEGDEFTLQAGSGTVYHFVATSGASTVVNATTRSFSFGGSGTLADLFDGLAAVAASLANDNGGDTDFDGLIVDRSGPVPTFSLGSNTTDTLTIGGNWAAAMGFDGTASPTGASSGTAGDVVINGETISLTAGDGAAQILSKFQSAAGSSSGTDEFSVNNTGGVLTITGTNGNDVAISGDAATLAALGLSATTEEGTPAGANPRRAELVSTYNDLLAQITAIAKDSGFNGVNLLNGDDLSVLFNEDGASKLTIEGEANSAAALGLATQASTAFDTDDGIGGILDSLRDAIDSLRVQAGMLGSKLSVIETRQTFTNSMISVLETGASNLTLADANDEAANVLALQTRQQLSSTALSLASQADQNVLRLF